MEMSGQLLTPRPLYSWGKSFQPSVDSWLASASVWTRWWREKVPIHCPYPESKPSPYTDWDTSPTRNTL